MVRPLQRVLAAAAVATVMAATVACHHVDNHRLPVSYVNLMFWSQSDWDLYGVSGAGQWKYFNRDKRVPSGYFYQASSLTGFGGVLLCSSYIGEPVAYDAACPVECRADVTVFINEDLEAECPVCHSLYGVFDLLGHPIGGPAAEKGYGLQVYHVGPGRNGEYMVIY